jgi:hypothetical protein
VEVFVERDDLGTGRLCKKYVRNTVDAYRICRRMSGEYSKRFCCLA